jgi:hypothetical protein
MPGHGNGDVRRALARAKTSSTPTTPTAMSINSDLKALAARSRSTPIAKILVTGTSPCAASITTTPAHRSRERRGEFQGSNDGDEGCAEEIHKH